MTFKVVYLFIPFFGPEIKSGMRFFIFYFIFIFSFFFVFFFGGDVQRITIFKVVALCFRIGVEM